MKIILRFCQTWGSIHTITLEIDNNLDPHDFLNKIAEKVNLKNKNFISRLERDGFMIRITTTFPLSFYQFKEKSIIFIEKIENVEDQQKTLEERINFRYFQKLGLLKSIIEEDEEKRKGFDNENEETKENSTSTIKNFLSFKKRSKTPSSSDSKNHSPIYEHDIKNKIEKKSFEVKSYIDGQIELLLKETKNGNKEEIISILETLTDFIPDQFLDDIRSKKKKLFDEVGPGGWNALHFAVFYGKSEICSLFIERKADINKKTASEDGWTPLQLAIQKNHIDIVKMLLKCPYIDVNMLTPKGTALHLACKSNKIVLASLIVTAPGCNPKIKNSEGYLAADLTNNNEIINACEKYSKILKEEIVEEISQEIEEKVVKPPIVFGILYKIGRSYMRLNSRYFVLNADDGTFIRFKSKNDFPLKPLEIIALKDIKNITYKKKAGFLLRGAYNFFEIKTNSSSQTLACSFPSTLKAWVKHLNNGRNYCLSVENRLKDMKENNNDLGLMKLIKRLSINQKDYSIVIEDQEKAEDRAMNIFSNKVQTNNQNQNKKAASPTDNNKKVHLLAEVKRSSSSSHSEKKMQNNLNPFIMLKHPSNPLIPERNEKSEELELPKNLVEEKICFKSFKIIKVLGSGAFGKVFMVKKKDNGKIYAMKALRKKTLLMKKQMKYACSEASILKNSNHPFILQLHHCFQTPQFLYMVLDYCSSGDISLILAQQTEGRFEENVAKFYICELILALEYIHKNNIIYRDLKPENILIKKDGHIKLADFGLSKEGIEDGERTKSFCGSPAYLSPEMVRNKGASKATDIYGIGTVLYEMITGCPPYYDDDLKKMYQNIDEGNLTFPSYTSEEVQDLIRKLMDKNPESRIGIKDKDSIKKHPFFDGVDWEKVLKKEYDPPELVEIEEDEDSHDKTHKGVNQFLDHDYDDYNTEVNRVKNFSFTELGSI